MRIRSCTCPSEQLTPYQPQGVFELSQPLLLDQDSPFVLLYSETSASHSETGISKTVLQSNARKQSVAGQKITRLQKAILPLEEPSANISQFTLLNLMVRG